MFWHKKMYWPEGTWQVGLSNRHCSYCGELMVEYSVPSYGYCKYEITGKRIIYLYALCPNRAVSFSRYHYDIPEYDVHDGIMVVNPAHDKPRELYKIQQCAYCGNDLVNNIECHGCGARRSV